MVEEQPLPAAQAAPELGIPTKALLRLVYERKIRYLMVDGVAHVAPDAVEEYRSKALESALLPIPTQCGALSGQP